MFEILDEINENEFSWESIGDLNDGRLNLGNEMPVFVYRLFQFTIKNQLVTSHGKKETIEIFRKAGKVAGINFANKMLDTTLPFNGFIANLQKILEECKMGLLRIETHDVASGDLTLTIAEDLDCSGLPITGETVCNFDEGFLAGILSVYTKCAYDVIEVDCWSTGSRVCRFVAKVI